MPTHKLHNNSIFDIIQLRHYHATTSHVQEKFIAYIIIVFVCVYIIVIYYDCIIMLYNLNLLKIKGKKY